MSLVKSILHATKMGFKWTCFCLSVILTIRQIVRFAANKDVSVISNRKFLENPDDYPTFTFCLANDPKAIYNDKTDELVISKDQYATILTGLKPTVEVTDQKLKSILSARYEELTTQMADIVTSVKFEFNKVNETSNYNGKSGNHDSDTPLNQLLSPSYRDPTQVCFTRKDQTNVKGSRKKDELILDVSALSYVNSKIGTIKFYIHVPGQIIRQLHIPSLEIKLNEIRYDGQLYVSVYLPYISVLKKRPDAMKKCNKTLKNDDLEFKQRVIEEVGCVPQYWKTASKNNAGYYG